MKNNTWKNVTKIHAKAIRQTDIQTDIQTDKQYSRVESIESRVATQTKRHLTLLLLGMFAVASYESVAKGQHLKRTLKKLSSQRNGNWIEGYELHWERKVLFQT